MKKIVVYCIKFLATYFLLYYGSYAIIGLSVKGGYYSGFIHDWFNYPAWLRSALLNTSKSVLDILGYEGKITEPFKVGIVAGRSVKVVYSCLGLAIYSFWIAFIAANAGSLKKKLLFTLGGVAIIFLVNTARIVLLVITANRNKYSYFELNHHTFFNIVSYGIVFLMIYFFARTDKKNDWNKSTA